MELEDLKGLQTKGTPLFRLIPPLFIPDVSEHEIAAAYHVVAVCSASNAVPCAHSAQPKGGFISYRGEHEEEGGIP